jgi:thiol-disulfide isomerase/thioredoxin
MKRRILIATACLVFLTASLVRAKRLPNLEFRGINGSAQKLADLRGSIAVVNFWATWCAPCREEMPMLSRLTQEYAGKKVRFIAISADEDPETAKNRAKIDQYLDTQKPAMEIWLGADLDMLERLGLSNVLPGTLILDENGEPVTRIQGQAREEDVRTALDWLLNGKSGSPPAALSKRY